MVFTVGFFSLLHIEFDLNVLAAVLAVMGYSVNDTVVVFDRIREDFRKIRKGTPIEIMNTAINETLSRTIMTSGVTLLVVIALLILGGPVLHGFSAGPVRGHHRGHLLIDLHRQRHGADAGCEQEGSDGAGQGR